MWPVWWKSSVGIGDFPSLLLSDMSQHSATRSLSLSLSLSIRISMLSKALDYSNSLLSLLPAYRSSCLSLSLSLIEDSRYPTKCLYALSLVHTGGCQKKGKEITHRNDACVSSSCQICCRDSMRRSITPHTRYLYPGLYSHPKGKYHHLLCTHGAMLPIFASVSFKAVVIVVIIYYYFGSEKIVSTDSIGALQRSACWDSWTRHVTLRILVLTNHAHTHTFITNAYNLLLRSVEFD